MEAEPIAPHQSSKGESFDTGTDYMGLCIGSILVEGCYNNLFIIFVVWYTVLGLGMIKAVLRQSQSLYLISVF